MLPRAMEVNHTDLEFSCYRERRHAKGKCVGRRVWRAEGEGVCPGRGGAQNKHSPPGETLLWRRPRQWRPNIGGLSSDKTVPVPSPDPPCPQHPPGCPLLAFTAGCPSLEFVIPREWHPLRCSDNIPPLMGALILLACPAGVHLGPRLGLGPGRGLCALRGAWRAADLAAVVASGPGVAHVHSQCGCSWVLGSDPQ